jgi:hypothetical protein
MIFTPNMKPIIFTVFLILGLVSLTLVKAQKLPQGSVNRIDSLHLDSLNDLEIRLEALGKLMIISTDEQERLTSAYHFVKSFVKALRIENSYF